MNGLSLPPERTPCLIDVLRTPIGRLGGVLATARPDDLLADTIRALVGRNPWLAQEPIEDLYAGAANQAGEDNRNVARMAVLLAGLPDTIPGVTVNRLCASGLEAIAQAARAIACGEGTTYLAGGVESMTRAPYVMGKAQTPFERGAQLQDTTLGWRFINEKLSRRYAPISMGETAENVAERHQVSRADQDAYGLRSQTLYAQALAAGAFAEEIIPVTVPGLGGPKAPPVEVTADEHPRQTTLEKLGALRPAFREGGSVTAGNAAGLNDGAGMAVLMSLSRAHELGLTPMAILRGIAVAGVDPHVMGLGPVPAIEKLCARTGIALDQVDLVEINEAFAAQVLACQRLLGLDIDRLNVHGGAIAVGHPLGMSGVRLSSVVTRALGARGGRYGISAACIGVGQGVATLWERP